MYYSENDFIETFTNAVKDMIQHKEGCYHWHLGIDNNKNNWAIVLGWENGFEENKDDEASDGTWHLCAKVAYQPNNSIMQCDYNIDWIMPHDEKSNDIWDTDTTVYLIDNHKATLDWLLKQFNLMKETLSCWQ